MNLRHSLPLINEALVTPYREDISPDKLRAGKNQNIETRIRTPDSLKLKDMYQGLKDQDKLESAKNQNIFSQHHIDSMKRLQDENQKMKKEMNDSRIERDSLHQTVNYLNGQSGLSSQKEEEFSKRLQLEKEEHNTLTTQHAKELQRKDEEIENKDAQIEELNMVIDEYKRTNVLSNIIRDKNNQNTTALSAPSTNHQEQIRHLSSDLERKKNELQNIKLIQEIQLKQHRNEMKIYKQKIDNLNTNITDLNLEVENQQLIIKNLNTQQQSITQIQEESVTAESHEQQLKMKDEQIQELENRIVALEALTKEGKIDENQLKLIKELQKKNDDWEVFNKKLFADIVARQKQRKIDNQLKQQKMEKMKKRIQQLEKELNLAKADQMEMSNLLSNGTFNLESNLNFEDKEKSKEIIEFPNFTDEANAKDEELKMSILEQEFNEVLESVDKNDESENHKIGKIEEIPDTENSQKIQNMEHFKDLFHQDDADDKQHQLYQITEQSAQNEETDTELL